MAPSFGSPVPEPNSAPLARPSLLMVRLGARARRSEANRISLVESWLLPEIDNTDWMPPAISPHNGLAYFANRVDGTYEYLAIDWQTGGA